MVKDLVCFSLTTRIHSRVFNTPTALHSNQMAFDISKMSFKLEVVRPIYSHSQGQLKSAAFNQPCFGVATAPQFCPRNLTKKKKKLKFQSETRLKKHHCEDKLIRNINTRECVYKTLIAKCHGQHGLQYVILFPFTALVL